MSLMVTMKEKLVVVPKDKGIKPSHYQKKLEDHKKEIKITAKQKTINKMEVVMSLHYQ